MNANEIKRLGITPVAVVDGVADGSSITDIKRAGITPVSFIGDGGGGSDIPDGSITNAKLANNAVTSSKIQSNQVTRDKLNTEVRDELDDKQNGARVIGGQVDYNNLPGVDYSKQQIYSFITGGGGGSVTNSNQPPPMSSGFGAFITHAQWSNGYAVQQVISNSSSAMGVFVRLRNTNGTYNPWTDAMGNAL